MRRAQPFLFVGVLAVFTVFAAGCAVNGAGDVAPYEVSVVAPVLGVATGVTARVQVTIRGTSHEDWGGWGAGPQVPSLSVEHVTCAPDCVATSSGTGSTSYEVSAATAGPRKVEFALSTSDGKHSVETATIDFRDPTRIDARRGASSPSGTVYGLIPEPTEPRPRIGASPSGGRPMVKRFTIGNPLKLLTSAMVKRFTIAIVPDRAPSRSQALHHRARRAEGSPAERAAAEPRFGGGARTRARTSLVMSLGLGGTGHATDRTRLEPLAEDRGELQLARCPG